MPRFPDPVKYHAAVYLMRVIDWSNQKNVKPLLEIEQAAISVPLEGLGLASPIGSILTHPLIGDTFDCVISILKTNLYPPQTSKLHLAQT